MKALLLINGAAVVAILAYLGNITGHTHDQPNPDGVRYALWSFAGGVFCASITFCISYLTQLRLYEEGKGEETGKHVCSLYVGIGMAFLSIVCFVCGTVIAGCALVP
jgi:hypothetical protein